MVVRINPPEYDSVDIVSKTIEEKVRHRAFYDGIKNDLISRVKLYCEMQGNPEFLKPISLRDYTSSDKEAGKRKTSLIGLYKPSPDRMPYEQLEKIRKKNGLTFCPSCGEAGRPRTLDHYLPKDVFPEYSITILNLTPMCDWCQGEKNTEYISPKGSKIYIHPYFDDVNMPLYSVVFAPPYRSPIIDFRINRKLSVDTQNLIRRHLTGLDLPNRFKEYFGTKYIDVLRKAKNAREGGGVELRALLREFLSSAEHAAVNTWEAVLYRSILEDEALLHFLENDPLPCNL